MTHAEEQASQINKNTNAGFEKQGKILQEILTAMQGNAAPQARGEPKVRAAPKAKAEPKANAEPKPQPPAESVAEPFSLEQFPAAVKVADGIFYVPQMLQTMGVDPAEILSKLTSLPAVSEDADIVCDFMSPVIVEGKADALHYRGSTLPRQKVFLQINPQDGLRRYKYPGWQWAISKAMKDIESVPEFSNVLKKTNDLTTAPKFNAGIGTLYRSGEDYIGAHSDKTPDLLKNSWLLIYRVGPPRVFQILDKGKIFWSGNVGDGDALWMDLKANEKYKHALPEMANVAPSGSLVFRNVATVIPWANVTAEIEKSRAQKK